MNDEQIIELYWNRDESAIQHTDEKYGPYCFTIANAILADREDSEECVNDTWMKTWNSIPPTRPNVFKQFLAKITRNLSFDRYRKATAAKRGGNSVDAVLDELTECVADTKDIASEIEAKELAACINRFLNTISKRDGDIFIRRYFYVESAAAIGKRFSMTERNVLVTLSRTRTKLKAYLVNEGYAI